MRPAPFCLLAAFLLLFCSPCLVADDHPSPKRAADLISQSAFCIAYVIRDADNRDQRPVPDGDPFQPSEEGVREGSILSRGGDGIVDVPALTSRVTAQARLSKEQISRLSAAVLETDHFHSIADCYEPHHAFVFYSRQGDPLCCIEICFSCNRIKTSPELRGISTNEELEAAIGADLITLAKIFDELKLPLAPYHSFAKLKKLKTEQEQKSKARILEARKVLESAANPKKETPEK
jgi:hypothetical protein